MKRFISRFLAAGQDNRGSAIVITLISVAFIMIMGSILMFSSYMGMSIKVSQNVGERDFYNAETAMDEIRANLQVLVSDLLEEAYEELLFTFNGTYSEIEPEFQNIFRKKLLNAEVGGTPLINQSSWRYNAHMLNGFTTSDEANVFANDGSGALAPAIDSSFSEAGVIRTNLDPDDNITELVLTNVRVRHAAENGYISQAASDITISIPNFSFAGEDAAAEEFAKAAFVCTGLASNTVAVTIKGNAYAGTAEFGNGGRVTLQSRLFVCAKELKVNLGPGNHEQSPGRDNWANSDFFADNSNIWAGRIEVREGAYLHLGGGRTNVLDDLELGAKTSGSTSDTRRNSRAYLSGDYLGFGGETHFTKGDSAPEKSSAILVNGMDTQLDMSGLDSLTLAGLSYISAEPGENARSVHDVPTGKSFSVKSDQFAYLAPSNAVVITGTAENPGLRANPAPGSNAGTAIDIDLPWGEKLSAYTGSDLTRPVTVPVGGGMTYHYINFASRERANAYFKEYFRINAAEVQSHINMYLNPNAFRPAGGNIDAEGLVYDGSNSPLPFWEQASGNSISSNLDAANTSFKNLRISLSETDDGSHSRYGGNPPANPYRYAVRVNEVGNLPTGPTYYRDNDDKVVAMAVNNTSSFNLSDIPSAYRSSMRLIISTGSIVVNEHFTGLILSDGDITLQANVTADAAGVTEAMSAKNDVYGEFSQLMYFEPRRVREGGDGTPWNLSRIVRYENWKRNWN
jgi:hypothetical protein